jgi:hypothetical protein
VNVEYAGGGIPCDALAAWLAGDSAGLRQRLSADLQPLVSLADRADRELYLAELLVAGGSPDALPLVERACRARDALPDLLSWRRAESRLLREVARRRAGLGGDGAPAALAVARAELRAAVPGHRFLRLEP